MGRGKVWGRMGEEVNKPAPYLRDIGEEFETRTVVTEDNNSRHLLVTRWKVTGYDGGIPAISGLIWGESVMAIQQTIVPLTWLEAIAALTP